MSKKSKKLQKERQLSKKRAKRNANKLLFQERARLGQNTKSTRALRSNKKNKRHMSSHPFGQCGNIGCKKCNPNWPS